MGSIRREDRPGQLPLFTSAEAPRAPAVHPVAVDPAVRDLAARLPKDVHLGASSWSFPGWDGLVYAHPYPQTTLARQGLAAYARHPLLRAVGIDRTFYGPVDTETMAAYAGEVPEHFRFLAKAHEYCTRAHFPNHPRYGDLRGRPNPYWLDAAYAADAVVAPFVDGLAEKGGVLLFQFSRQDEQRMGGRHGFPQRLEQFLRALPTGPRYAIELRNHKLMTPGYVETLAGLGVLHCISVHPTMPDVRTQAQLVGALDGPLLVVRWMLAPRMNYETAVRYYHPFDTLVDPDPIAREEIAELVRSMSERGKSSVVIVNNKAEGCAPRSIRALAEAIVGESDRE